MFPLTPYKPQKSRMDGLSGKNFSCGVVFPDNKAFRKLCFARCLIENMVTLFYQTAIDHVYFYEIEFAKLIIRYRPPSLAHLLE